MRLKIPLSHSLEDKCLPNIQSPKTKQANENINQQKRNTKNNSLFFYQQPDNARNPKFK